MGLQEAVESLQARVSRLESGPHTSPPATDHDLIERLLSGAATGGDPAEAAVAYAGAGPREDGVVAWRSVRTWADVLGADPDVLAFVFSALASPMRIRIVMNLAESALSTRELAERLHEPTAGQLFHHLKDLLAANVVYQPVRGTYAIRHQHLVPLLAALSVAVDLGHHPGSDPHHHEA